MMYRYGDATPFPLDDNFIETICAATEACVGLFQADMAAEERRRKVAAIRQHAEEELKRLNVLNRAVDASLRPMLPSGKAERTSEATASKISAATRAAIKTARAGVEKRRDAAVRAAYGRQLSDQILDALSLVLLDHQLPKTRWTIRWMYDDERSAAQVVLQSNTPASDLIVDYGCELPDTHRFRGPVRVGELTPHLQIELLGKGKLRKKERPMTHNLSRYYITEAELSPTRSSFVLRRSHKKASPGFVVVMREEDQALPKITRIEADGSSVGAALTLSGDSAVALGSLWEKIEHGLHDLRSHRDVVLSGSFEEVPLERVDDPAGLAEAILDTLAPIVREMRLRSKVPGELILKRDRGDGCREELFVPRARLEAMFATLPDPHRRYFEAVGLSSEATCEFVGREFPLSAPAGVTPSPQPQVRARRSSPPPTPAKPPQAPTASSPQPPPPPRKQTMSSLPDLPVPPEKSGKVRVDTDAITATA